MHINLNGLWLPLLDLNQRLRDAVREVNFLLRVVLYHIIFVLSRGFLKFIIEFIINCNFLRVLAIYELPFSDYDFFNQSI